MRQRLEPFGDRAVVARVDQRRGGEADEVEFGERRTLAVELGEIAEHAAAEPRAGESAARGAVERDGGRAGRPGAARQRAFQIGRRRDQHDRERRTEARDDLPERREFGREPVDLGDDRLQPGRRAERFGRLGRLRQRRAIMAAARVVVADEMRDAHRA